MVTIDDSVRILERLGYTHSFNVGIVPCPPRDFYAGYPGNTRGTTTSTYSPRGEMVRIVEPVYVDVRA